MQREEIGLPIVYVDLSRNRLPAIIARVWGEGIVSLVAFVYEADPGSGLGTSRNQGVFRCRYAPVHSGTPLEVNSWHHIIESRLLENMDAQTAYRTAYDLGEALAALSGNPHPEQVDRSALMVIAERFAALEGMHDLRQGLVYVKGFTEGFAGFTPTLIEAPKGRKE